MRNSKQISITDEDKLGNEREKIIQISLIKNTLRVNRLEIKDLLKMLCIAVDCDGDCKHCILRNEDSFMAGFFKEGFKHEKEMEEA